MQPSRKTARRGRRETSLLRALNGRSLTGNPRGAKLWAEDESVFRHRLEYLDLAADTTRSTIAVAFSSDGKLLASTHGDHTVKITSFLRGRVVQTLQGHHRTPWTVKFHPKDSSIVASGCLGFEVRVWNVATGRCLHSSQLDVAIISLSFHPSGHVLAVASGQSVYLWDYKNKPEPYVVWRHPHTLRCVRFTPDGAGIIVGAANNSPSRPWATNQAAPRGAARGAAGGGAAGQAPALVAGQAEVTFRLQVWDFSLDAALAEHVATAMTRPRVILHQALLYNDGGFDVSQDGLWLCAIAELWKVASDPAAAAAVAPARPSSPAARARDGAATTAAAAEAAAVAVAAGGGNASPTRISGRERLVAAAPAAGLRVVAGGGDGGSEERHEASLSMPRRRGQDDAPHVENRQWGLALPPRADVGTKMEVDGEAEMEGGVGGVKVAEVGEKVEGAEVVAPGWVRRDVATAIACEESGGGKERDLSAPRHGSQLGRHHQPLFVGVAAAASPLSPPQTMLSVAAAAAEGRAKAGGRAGGVDNFDGQKHTERGAAAGGRSGSLAPWPSRMRPRRYFSGAGDHGVRGEHVGGSGVLVAGAGAGGGAHQARQRGGLELSPKTPSPRITLKRRLSSPWCSSAGSRSGNGSDGFLGRKRQGRSVLKTGTMGRVAEASARAGGESGEAGAGAGARSGGVGEDRNGCHSPVGLEPGAAAVGGAEEEEEEERSSPPRYVRGSEGEFARQERDRPPPLPPPVVARRESSPCSSSSSSSSSLSLSLLSSSSALPLRPPAPVSAAPISEGLRASLFPLLATSWGRGSASPSSSPPADAALLGPAAAAAAADGGYPQVQAHAGGAAEKRRRRGGDAGRRGGGNMGRRGEADPPPLQPPPPPPPVFFLQVPGGVAAAVSEEGLCPPILGATAAEAPSFARGEGGGVSTAGGGAEGNTVERRIDSQLLSGGGSGRFGSGVGSGSGAGRFDQPSDEDIPRAASSGDGRGRELLLPAPLPPPPPGGKFVPHLVLVSLNAEGGGGRAARVVRAAAMDSLSAKQVTSVKLSPSARYILLGAGVLSERTRQEPRRVASSKRRGGGSSGAGGGVSAPRPPPVTSIYSASDLRPANLMPTADDDVNIACFHPEPGMGCVYGTKQGRVCLVRMAD